MALSPSGDVVAPAATGAQISVAPALTRAPARTPWTRCPSVWYIPLFLIAWLAAGSDAHALVGDPPGNVRDIVLRADAAMEAPGSISVVDAWPKELEEKTVVKLARTYRGDVPLWKVWHGACCHMSLDATKAVVPPSEVDYPAECDCEACILGKFHKAPMRSVVGPKRTFLPGEYWLGP